VGIIKKIKLIIFKTKHKVKVMVARIWWFNPKAMDDKTKCSEIYIIKNMKKIMFQVHEVSENNQ